MENQISIEEIKAAVLAECEHLARLGDYEVDESQQPLELSVCKENGQFQYQIYCVGENIFIPKYHAAVSDQSWIKWYRLLGLESRAKDAEIQRLRNEIEELRRNGGGEIIGPHTLSSEVSQIDESEIQRLREGLKSIVDYEGESWMDFNDKYCELRDIARNALEGGNQ